MLWCVWSFVCVYVVVFHVRVCLIEWLVGWARACALVCVLLFSFVCLCACICVCGGTACAVV